MKKKKWLIIGVGLAVVIIALLLFLGLGKRNTNGIDYTTEKVQRGNLEALVSTTGTLNPVILVEVGSQVSGRISKIYADFNTRVKAGQVVAEIDPSQILTRVQQNEANYESSKASLEKAKVALENLDKQYRRALKLFEKELISYEEKESVEAQYLSAKAEVQSSESRLLQAKSQLDSAKVDLEYTVIKSPIDGIVILRSINVGQTVAASFQAPVLFKIANDLSKMQVECSIDEADIGKIQEGQEARFTVDAFPDEQFTGKVIQVRYSPEVIQNVVTYTTIVDVSNPGLKLRPGMTATVSIITGKAENALMVPNPALRFTPELSPEEMKAIFQRVRSEMMSKAGSTPNTPGGGERGGPGAQPGGRGMFMGGSSSGDRTQRTRQLSRVWILDKNEQLTPVLLRTGVSDDNYTEVKWGNLVEGQLVITGLGESSNSPSHGPRPDMMFRRG
jgi:HlyD family secretion protein